MKAKNMLKMPHEKFPISDPLTKIPASKLVVKENDGLTKREGKKRMKGIALPGRCSYRG